MPSVATVGQGWSFPNGGLALPALGGEFLSNQPTHMFDSLSNSLVLEMKMDP